MTRATLGTGTSQLIRPREAISDDLRLWSTTNSPVWGGAGPTAVPILQGGNAPYCCCSKNRMSILKAVVLHPQSDHLPTAAKLDAPERQIMRSERHQAAISTVQCRRQLATKGRRSRASAGTSAADMSGRSRLKNCSAEIAPNQSFSLYAHDPET